MAGSIRKLNIRGIDFNVIGDSDIDIKPPVTVEGIACSGSPIMKSTVQIVETTGFKVEYSKRNNELLTSWIVDGQDSEVNYTDENGDTSYCTARFTIESTSTMNGEIPLKLLPVTPWV